MAFSSELADRVRGVIHDEPSISEKKMFGGLAFLLNGNMCCGIIGDELMVRVGADAYPATLERPHVREMDFTGRALKGFIYVLPDGTADDAELAGWVRQGVRFAQTLPAKK